MQLWGLGDSLYWTTEFEGFLDALISGMILMGNRTKHQQNHWALTPVQLQYLWSNSHDSPCLSESCCVPVDFSILTHLLEEGWWYQNSLSAGSRPCFPCLCRTDGSSFPAVPEQTGLMAPGRQQGPASSSAGIGPLPPVWEKEPGVSVPQALLCHGAFLYQMVKSTGTGFSFPPKLDKLKSNELVRGKINPVHFFQKAPPFTDFLSENITDITCWGT